MIVAAFVAILLFCCTSYASPPMALALGLILSLTLGNPFKKLSSKTAKYLLQISVVGLGFGMNLGEVISAGKTGVMITIFSIAGTLVLGYMLGKLLVVNSKAASLISSGTAICGGSAIAAMAPILGANEKEISISLGTVFILNSIALFVFPVIGHFFGLTSHQFGVWAAVAIHDTSSVVGAAAKYSPDALKVATVIKLTRALWIVPLSLLAAFVFKNRSSKSQFPYFIFAFVLASCIVTLLPNMNTIYMSLTHIAKIGLTITLFLIGSGLSKETLKTVGFRPILLGTILWVIVSSVSLLLVRFA